MKKKNAALLTIIYKKKKSFLFVLTPNRDYYNIYFNYLLSYVKNKT